MIGLMIIAAFALYLALSYWVVSCTVKWARRTGHGVKRWAAAAILFMYLLMFWDHIPTLLLYHYYCDTKAGFWVYKTPEQWKTENPGVAKTLTWKKRSDRFEGEKSWGWILNERFIWRHSTVENFLLPVQINNMEIVDIKDKEVVVKWVAISAGYKGGMAFYRFWTSLETYTPESDFYAIKSQYEKIGDF